MEEGKISSFQLTRLVMSFMMATGLIFPPLRGVWQDSWLTLLFGLAGGIVFALIYTTLCLRFPGQTLIEIYETVFGPIIGKLFSVAFLWYIFYLGAQASAIFITLLTTTVFTMTPRYVFSITWIIVSVYLCKKGIEVIARVNEPLLLVTVFLIVGTLFLVLNLFDPENFLPLWNISLSELLWAGFGTITFPFGLNIVFGLILPFLQQREQGRSAVIKGLGGAALVLLISLLITVGVLGEVGEIFLFPTYQAFRMIQIGQVLTRLELIPTLNFLTMGFIKVTIALYAVSLGTAQLCKLQTYRPLVFPLGILMLIAAHQSHPNIGVSLEMIERVQPFYALPFQLLLPLLTLLVAVFRRLPVKEGQT